MQMKDFFAINLMVLVPMLHLGKLVFVCLSSPYPFLCLLMVPFFRFCFIFLTNHGADFMFVSKLSNG